MSASLNTGEKGRWQNRFDSQFTCNISDSSTLGSCWAVLPRCRGKPSPVCDSRVGRAELVRRATRHLLIRVRQGVSLHSPEIQQASSSYLCLLRRPLCVYWLGTTRHWELSSKCRFTKGWAGGGEVCTVRALWICWCGSPSGSPKTRQMLQLRKDWGVRPGPLSHPGSFHLIAHWYIKQLYAMLKDVRRTGLHYSNSLCQSTNKCSLSTLRLHPHSPSLQLFATGAKLLQKGAKVKIFPCETTISISSQFTGVSLSPWRYSTSRLHFQTSTIGERRRGRRGRRQMPNVNCPPRHYRTQTYSVAMQRISVLSAEVFRWDYCSHPNTILVHGRTFWNDTVGKSQV